MNDSLKVTLAILVPGLISGLVFFVALSLSEGSPQGTSPPPTPPLLRAPVRDQAAEEALKKLEEVYLNAPTLIFSYHSEFCGEGPAQSSRGTCLLKGGAKMRFSNKTVQSWEMDKEDLTLVSDGKKLFSSMHPKVLLDLPEDLNSAIRLLVVRAGPGACRRLDALLFPEEHRGKPGDLYVTRVDEITFGAQRDGLKSLRYWLHFSDPRAGFDMVLWYDPSSYRIVSYENEGPRSLTDCGTRDRIFDCTIGADIPDEEFVLPEG